MFRSLLILNSRCVFDNIIQKTGGQIFTLFFFLIIDFAQVFTFRTKEYFDNYMYKQKPRQ